LWLDGDRDDCNAKRSKRWRFAQLAT